MKFVLVRGSWSPIGLPYGGSWSTLLLKAAAWSTLGFFYVMALDLPVLDLDPTTSVDQDHSLPGAQVDQEPLPPPSPGRSRTHGFPKGRAHFGDLSGVSRAPGDVPPFPTLEYDHLVTVLYECNIVVLVNFVAAVVSLIAVITFVLLQCLFVSLIAVIRVASH